MTVINLLVNSDSVDKNNVCHLLLNDIYEDNNSH